MIDDKEKAKFHTVLTRFNVNTDFCSRISDPDEWLSERFHYLETLTGPSLANQSSREFCWVVFADERRLGPRKHEMETLAKRWKFLIKYVNHSSQIPNSVSNLANQKRAKILVSTRLDSDDIVHKDFIKDIQYEAGRAPIIEEKVVIDFPRTIFARPNSKLGKVQISADATQFISLVERQGPFDTVLVKSHPEMGIHYKTIRSRRIRTCTMIHGGNVANELPSSTLTSSAKFYLFSGLSAGPAIRLLSSHFWKDFLGGK